ncbi:MAG: hypothetical protein KBS57_06150, partial [Alistipes sp.]|nr:hypothetical protein [Candidatus Minthomonas equi]
MKRLISLTLFLTLITSLYAGDFISKDKMYLLVSPAGFAVDNGNSTQDESTFTLRPVDKKNLSQRFCIRGDGTGWSVWSPYTGQAFDILDPGEHGCPLSSWIHNNCDNQRWDLEFINDNQVKIRHK